MTIEQVKRRDATGARDSVACVRATMNPLAVFRRPLTMNLLAVFRRPLSRSFCASDY
jgi:hypothetical protein